MDAYINKCSAVTRPVVIYLRSLVRETVPDIEEKIKWGSPSFELNGKIVCQVMAHQKHLSFIFTYGKEWKDTHGLLTNFGEKSNMTGLKQITRMEDLPDKKILQDYIKTAANHVRSLAGTKPKTK